MSDITAIDPIEMRAYSKMSTDGHVGVQARSALDTYTTRLGNISGIGFNSNDTSTAHAVIDALNAEISTLSESMEMVDSMMDALIESIITDILDKEDELSKTITGG